MYQNLGQQMQQQQISPYYYPYMQRAPQPDMSTMQMQLQSQSQNYIKGRPVVSLDEARASQIDLDGSLYVFTDIGNKKIYTKQITMDGTASLQTYALVEKPINENPQQITDINYVTKEELEKAISELKKQLDELNSQQVKSAQKTPTVTF